MNPKGFFVKSFSIFLLLVFVSGGAGGVPVRAAQAELENTPPAGLSVTDWEQIQASLAATLPAQQAYLKASNTGGTDYFGISVAVSGDTVVVGATHEDSAATGVNGDQNDNSLAESGAVYVFIRSGGVWSQQAYLKASNPDAYDYFGGSVAISGDTVVVGAYAESSNATGVNGDQNDDSLSQSGAAYVFTRSGTTWSQQAYLKASNTEYKDYFGSSVAISGDTLVVGAQDEDSNATGVDGDQSNNSIVSSGAAYVFTRGGTIWSQQAYLKASNTGAGDFFGSSVAISGDSLVVGARNESSSATGVDGNQNDNSANFAGAAYVFTRGGSAWSQQAYLKASNTGAADYFGWSVAISGDTLVVGANEEDSNATGVDGDGSDNSIGGSGAAYVFIHGGTTWTQQAYLKASNTGMGDGFGCSVAISGDSLVVGAFREDSNATGVNGNQDDNAAGAESGAVYDFTRSRTTWSQQAYIKASNTGVGDNFGGTVSISGDTLVSGAMEEDSNATGVNGDQNNSLASGSGAAYVFAQPPSNLSLTLRSIGAYDSWILESGENTNIGGTRDSTSTTFNLGDGAADKQYRAVLSFNTASLPDNAVITKATLKIKKMGLSGTNPFTILGGLKVDIRKPFFGTTLALVVSDFQAAPGKSGVGTFGTPPVSNWYSADIGSAGYPYIHKAGTTQFRLYFTKDDNDDGNADYMKFYSGNYTSAASRPTLVVEYYLP